MNTPDMDLERMAGNAKYLSAEECQKVLDGAEDGEQCAQFFAETGLHRKLDPTQRAAPGPFPHFIYVGTSGAGCSFSLSLPLQSIRILGGLASPGIAP